MQELVKLLGREYRRHPEHATLPESAVRRLRSIVQSLDYCRSRCTMQERALYWTLTQHQAAVESMLDGYLPKEIAPAMELPFGEPGEVERISPLGL